MNERHDNTQTAKRDIRWLAGGALVGLLAAGYGILHQDSSAVALPEDSIARVNDVEISREQYRRALERLANEGLDARAPDSRSRVIGNLVEDELLLQRGLELGMAQSDVTVRAAIINSLIASVTAEADAANPTDETLAGYLTDNPDRFSFTASVAVQGWQTDDETLAQALVEQLRLDNDADIATLVEPIPDLPLEMMAVETLRDYVGPGVAAAAASMPEGGSAVFARRGRWLVLRVNRKEAAFITDLDSVRNRVLLDYRRSLASKKLQDYLDELRDRAKIEIAMP